MLEVIVFAPLIGALVAGLFGHKIGDRASEVITTSLLVAAAVLSWIAFFAADKDQVITLFRWIDSGDLQLAWSIYFDDVTSVMLVVVCTVSSLVHIYSISYMHEDRGRARFFSYLSLFTFAMLLLVTASNLGQLFFGWEGVGLASYLLIGFWHDKASANDAAIKAFVVNRVGDFLFVLGIFGVFLLFGTLDIPTVLSQVRAPGWFSPQVSWLGLDAITVVCLLLFGGAMGKSAQFLLHTWLPDAMEGPTPVSALIHAATMVTAGVFMVVRLAPMFEAAPIAMNVIAVIGSVTAVFAATVALVQTDIKRVVAYSTCSQLGYMFASIGIGAFGFALFHLFTHAFFKALLFLGSGSVIHSLHDEQNMSRMGGLRRKMPVTFVLMLIGTLALTGFPLTAGYFSKDAIIEVIYASTSPIRLISFTFLLFAAMLTALYSWRLMWLVFFGENRGSATVFAKAHESSMYMLIPMGILAVGSFFGGLLASGLFMSEQMAVSDREMDLMVAMHDVPMWVVFSPAIAMFVGFAISVLLYIVYPTIPGAIARQNWPLYDFLRRKWWFDEVYDFLFVQPTFALANVVNWFDRRVIDRFGPDGLASLSISGSRLLSRVQSGVVSHYVFVMFFGLGLLLTLSYVFTVSGSGS